MPNTREKLIQLLIDSPHLFLSDEEFAETADYLIANGVTVQQWIPVTERLPDVDRNVLVIDRITGEVTTAYLNKFNSFVFRDGRGHGASHWMPLPQPLKGE